MIDCHSHILPHMDDGADNVHISLAMLRASFLQSVDGMVSTSHYYADQEYPDVFLRRRQQAYEELAEAMLLSPEVYPSIALGAEVLYFPEISMAEDVAALTMGDSRCVLVEPPMMTWTNAMLDDIALMGENFHCTPVIAHVDRFMRVLEDDTLITRVRERNMIVQVNAEYFLDEKTRKAAFKNLKKGCIQLIGSDCHNMDHRAPNLGAVKRLAKQFGAEKELKLLSQNADTLLRWRG